MKIKRTVPITPYLCQERELVEHADHASVGGLGDFAFPHALHFRFNLHVRKARRQRCDGCWWNQHGHERVLVKARPAAARFSPGIARFALRQAVRQVWVAAIN